MHVYSMRGHTRERYIFCIAIVAVTVTAICNQVAGLVGVGISITVFTAFSLIYLAFDKYLWQVRWVNRLVGIPVLRGEWTIEGHTNGADGQPRTWAGSANIEQTWSQIAISIATSTSRSRSGIAGIERDPGHGFRVLYSYANDPKDTDTVLTAHRGTCDIMFSEDLSTAEATYYNNHQRHTYGTMTWQRVRNAE